MRQFFDRLDQTADENLSGASGHRSHRCSALLSRRRITPTWAWLARPAAGSDDEDRRRLRSLLESLAAALAGYELAALPDGGSSKFERWVEALIQRAGRNHHVD
ncbi:hypothetical protein AB0M37_24840 [Micromonospora chalcea]